MVKTTTDRKSFIIHMDSLCVLDDLTDEQAGQLFKAIKAYHYDDDYKLNQLLKIAFSQFKNQFIRDDEKYKNVCKVRAEAGSKGGKQRVANASKSKQKVANQADSKNKSDSDNKNVNKNEVKEVYYVSFDEFWEMYPRKVGKAKAAEKFKPDKRKEIMDGLARFCQHIAKEKIETQYIPHAATWLNQERWNDEYETIIHEPKRSKMDDITERIINDRNKNTTEGLSEVSERIDNSA